MNFYSLLALSSRPDRRSFKRIFVFILTCTFSCQHQKNALEKPSTKDRKYFEKVFFSLPYKLSTHYGTYEFTVYKIVAPWCGSCWEDLSSLDWLQEHHGKEKLRVILLNIDANSQQPMDKFKTYHIEKLSDKLNTSVIPQTFIFAGERLLYRINAPYDYKKLTLTALNH